MLFKNMETLSQFKLAPEISAWGKFQAVLWLGVRASSPASEMPRIVQQIITPGMKLRVGEDMKK